MKNLVSFIKSEDGTAAIEYGLLAALIAVVIIASLNAVGSSLTTTFGKISTALSGTTAR